MKLTVKLDFGCGREIKVGTFSEIGRDTAFEFAGEFLSSGLDPAPFRLRAGGGLKIYDRSGNMETFGLFDDSLPDGWGRRIVDRMFMKREGRLPTVTERLMCVGRSGKGALVYEPADEAAQAANEAFDLAALAEEAMAFDAGEAEDALQRLRKAGGSSGGARPKAYVGYNPKTGEARYVRKVLFCRQASSIGSSSSTRGGTGAMPARRNTAITRRRALQARTSLRAALSRRVPAVSS